jgi:very-short-patch-repair endonuclease
MDPQIPHSALWELTRRQHGVVTRRQLLDLGLKPDAVKHRVAKGRLHPVARGVYVVGRPELTLRGRFMAAVLGSGRCAALSGESAAALWGIRRWAPGAIEVSAPNGGASRGMAVRRRLLRADDLTTRDGIAVTTPVCTLIDLAARLSRDQLEAAINAADVHDLVSPDGLRAVLENAPPRRGVAALRRALDLRTFTLTRSALERRFLPIARAVGLPKPETAVMVNGFEVDFFWPDLKLVVETDGLRYHRTPAEQARDRRRDQAHMAAGLTQLRFTHEQVRFERAYVKSTLAAVARRVR